MHVRQYPWLFAFALFALSILLYSQAATVAALMGVGLQLGIAAPLLIAMFPAVNGYFFLPTYATMVAAIQFAPALSGHNSKSEHRKRIHRNGVASNRTKDYAQHGTTFFAGLGTAAGSGCCGLDLLRADGDQSDNRAPCGSRLSGRPWGVAERSFPAKRRPLRRPVGTVCGNSVPVVHWRPPRSSWGA